MLVKITVKDFDTLGGNRILETRWIEIGFAQRMNAFTAAQILRKEYPEFEGQITSRAAGKFHAVRAIDPSERCESQYAWRQYYIEASSKASMTRYKAAQETRLRSTQTSS